MPELTLPLLAAVAGVAFLAALAQGVTGFGSALVAMPLLALLIGVRAAAALVALLSLAINLALLLPARRRLPWRRVAALLAGSLAGVPAGVLLLAGVDPRLVRGILGGTLAAASAALLGVRRLSVGPGNGPALAAGALAGLLGGAFNVNGPVATLYAAARGWGKRETHAALQLYFFATGLWVVVLHGAAGITDRRTLLSAASSLPALALGSFAGWEVHQRMSEERFRSLVLLALLGAGIVLIIVSVGSGDSVGP